MLDPRTILVLSALFALLMMIVLLLQWRGTERVVNGVLSWALSFGLYTACAILLSLRSSIPDLFSVVIANGLLIAGSLLILDGVYRFKAMPARKEFTVGVIVLAMAGFAWFQYVDENYYMRVLIGGAGTLVIYLMSISAMARNHFDRWLPGELVFTGTLVVSCITTLLRVGSSLLDFGGTETLFSASGLKLTYLVSNLVSIIFIGLGMILMIQEMVRRDFEYLASHDALTGVLARRVILELLEKAMARVARSNQAFGLLMIDIDHFKHVNDHCGHKVGDFVLASIVRLVESQLRKDSYIGRYGGEEFIVVLPQVREGEVETVAERIRSKVEEATFSCQGAELRCTISIGAITIGQRALKTIEDPIKACDTALYKAKHHGRNRVHIHDCADPFSGAATT